MTAATATLPPRPLAPAIPTPAVAAGRVETERATLAADVFRSGLACLGVAALLGLGLRTLLWRGGVPLPFTHLLHAHSHLALLGWTGNAFFALALHAFLDGTDAKVARRVWLGQLLALAGMTVSFLVAGYGPASIAFCTLHLAGSIWLALRLRRSRRTSPLARDILGVAVVWLGLSCLGPLLLGPLAALGLRDESPYRLALHLYLHGLSRGWMPFFLLATLAQRCAPRLNPDAEHTARSALRRLAAGSALGFASPAFSDVAAPLFTACSALGAIAGLVGAWGLVRALRSAWRAAPERSAAPGWVGVAVTAFVVQGVLTLAVAAPRLAWLAGDRQAQIAFLHLVFLGVVSPLLFEAGATRGWFRRPRAAALSVWAFLVAAVIGEVLLGLLILDRAPNHPGAWLWAAALALALAIGGLVSAAFRRAPAAP